MAFPVFGLDVGFPVVRDFLRLVFWYGVEPLVGEPSLGTPSRLICSSAHSLGLLSSSPFSLTEKGGGVLMGFCMSGLVFLLVCAGLG